MSVDFGTEKFGQKILGGLDKKNKSSFGLVLEWFWELFALEEVGV